MAAAMVAHGRWRGASISEPSPTGETVRETDMTQILEAAKAADYQTAPLSLASRTWTYAHGNAEKAGWKRHLTLALLATAKAAEKKKLV